MPVRITGEVIGEVQIDRQLTRLRHGVEDLSSTYALLGEDFRETESQQFDHEGYGWTPLSPAYAERKQRMWGDKPILQASGAMRSAMIEQFTPGNVTRIGPKEAAFGVDLGKAYPRYHQTGTRKMPQRKVIDLQEADKRRMTKTMHRELVRISREAGFAVVDA